MHESRQELTGKKPSQGGEDLKQHPRNQAWPHPSPGPIHIQKHLGRVLLHPPPIGMEQKQQEKLQWTTGSDTHVFITRRAWSLLCCGLRCDYKEQGADRCIQKEKLEWGRQPWRGSCTWGHTCGHCMCMLHSCYAFQTQRV